MKTYILLLRGINVGGKRSMPMAGLVKMLIGMGFSRVQTYIQSGNIALADASGRSPQLIETQVQAEIAEAFGYSDVPVFCRTLDQWRNVTLSAALPSPTFDQKHVTFLNCEPQTDLPHGRDEKTGDLFVRQGREIFVQCEKYGRTKWNNQYFEKKLQCTATTRNWKTVMKMLELCSDICVTGYCDSE